MSAYTICGVRLNAVTNELVWRTRDDNGKFINTKLPEEKVLTYIKKLVGLHSVDALKKLLLNEKTCSIYYDGTLMTIEDYDSLAVKFSYFEKQGSHAYDHIDNQLGLTLTQKKQITSEDFQAVFRAVMTGDYTKIATQMNFLSFDLLALVLEKLGVKRLYLNELIVQRDIIGQMSDSLVNQRDLETTQGKSVSSVCQGALTEILKNRNTRTEAQRHKLLATFFKMNNNIQLGDEDYVEIVRMHFQSVMTQPNVLSILKAFKKGGLGLVQQFCELLGAAVCDKKSTFAHHRLDGGSRKILKYIFEEKYAFFEHIILGNVVSVNIRFVLLMVQLNCFFYDTNIKLSSNNVFDLADSFVTLKTVDHESLRKMLVYIIIELRKNKNKSNAHAQRFVYSAVAANVDILLINVGFVMDFYDYSMILMGGEDTKEHWLACQKTLTRKFDHALTLSEWFSYSKVPYFPDCMVCWWRNVLGFDQWKIPTKKF